MDNKFYVSLEAARLLKEKGYDRECVAYYQHGRFHPYSVDLFSLSTYNKNAAPPYMEQYSAPTKAEAIDWLESKGIVVEVNMNYCGLNNWHYILHRENILKAMYSEDDDIYFSTRLEAEEAAIIKALELL